MEITTTISKQKGIGVDRICSRLLTQKMLYGKQKSLLGGVPFSILQERICLANTVHLGLTWIVIGAGC